MSDSDCCGFCTCYTDLLNSGYCRRYGRIVYLQNKCLNDSNWICNCTVPNCRFKIQHERELKR